MQKLCAISGMPLATVAHFSNYFTYSLHPIMEVETSQLLSLIGTKSWFDWQEEEAKLLFLALANSIGLLEVTPPAVCNPSQATIASGIEMLVTIAGWYSMRKRKLPVYHVSPANSNESMIEFPKLLSSILSSRANAIAAELREAKADKLEEVIRILYSKCSIGANKHKMLRDKVADWALTVTHEAVQKERVTEETRALWRQMLTTPPIEAWRFQTVIDGKTSNVDIQELDEFLICNLPHGCTASYEVMKHMTAMKEATTQLASFLGGDLASVITVVGDAGSISRTTDFNDSSNSNFKSRFSAFAAEAPKPEAYASKLDYLIARAKYQQQQLAETTGERIAANRAQEIATELSQIADTEEELPPDSELLTAPDEDEDSNNSDEGEW